MIFLLRVVLTALLLPAAAACAELPSAVPVDGKPFRAGLAGVDAQWQLSFATAAEPRIVPAGDLVQWGTFSEPSRAPLLVLADGGLLLGEVLAADKETLTADSDLFATLKLPLEALAGVAFHPPATRPERDLLLDRIAQATGDADRVLLANGDEVAGMVEAITNNTVAFRAEVGELKIETQRIAAIIFNPSLMQKPRPLGKNLAGPLQAWAGFADGSRLLVTRLVLGEAKLQVTTAVGQMWQTTPKNLLTLEPLGGRAIYLSDLKAEGYRHTPYLDLAWPYRTDRTVTGGLLRCDGRLYLKGIGVHSAARLTYALREPYRRFEAELGIDDFTAGGGSVRFRVLVDGREKFSSDVVRGRMPPMPVSIDLGGAKQLDLVVDYADRGDVLDHADWLHARLVK
jgi:hypothetical protein